MPHKRSGVHSNILLHIQSCNIYKKNQQITSTKKKNWENNMQHNGKLRCKRAFRWCHITKIHTLASFKTKSNCPELWMDSQFRLKNSRKFQSWKCFIWKKWKKKKGFPRFSWEIRTVAGLWIPKNCVWLTAVVNVLKKTFPPPTNLWGKKNTYEPSISIFH